MDASYVKSVTGTSLVEGLCAVVTHQPVSFYTFALSFFRRNSDLSTFSVFPLTRMTLLTSSASF